jgi:hypothetical protein
MASSFSTSTLPESPPPSLAVRLEQGPKLLECLQGLS